MNLEEFRATGVAAIESELPHRDGYPSWKGRSYLNGALFIRDLGCRAWQVELWGDDFTGHLEACEELLWEGAIGEEMINVG